MTTQIVTPEGGRLVMGDCFQGSDKDGKGNPRTDRQGAPKTQWFIAVALPKTDPATQPIIDAIHAAAAGNQGVPLGDQALKYMDGDDPKYTDKEGFPGHLVIKFTSGFAPKCFDKTNQELLDPQSIRRGYYVRVSGTVKANGSTQSPGVYVSHRFIRLERVGEEISSGPTVEEAFGDAPTTPAAPTPVQDFGAGAPPPPPAPAAAVGPAMTPGCPYTHAQLSSQGWTDEQMRQAGHLV